MTAGCLWRSMVHSGNVSNEYHSFAVHLWTSVKESLVWVYVDAGAIGVNIYNTKRPIKWTNFTRFQLDTELNYFPFNFLFYLVCIHFYFSHRWSCCISANLDVCINSIKQKSWFPKYRTGIKNTLMQKMLMKPNSGSTDIKTAYWLIGLFYQ